MLSEPDVELSPDKPRRWDDPDQRLNQSQADITEPDQETSAKFRTTYRNIECLDFRCLTHLRHFRPIRYKTPNDAQTRIDMSDSKLIQCDRYFRPSVMVAKVAARMAMNAGRFTK